MAKMDGKAWISWRETLLQAAFFHVAGLMMPSSPKPPMTTATLEEAQAKLPELLERLRPGEEITITDHGQPLARMKKVERTSWPCQAGSYRKPDFWMAPDFDAPLEEFREDTE
jgi:prevent-host-death family protein